MDPAYTFICNVYHDFDQLALNLPELRRCYPDQRVVVVADGDPDPRYFDLATRLQCEFIAGEHLYGLDCGAAIVSRLLCVFLDSPGEYLVKFDSDTRFFRPFDLTPPGDASGCIWGAYGIRYLQGGCRLMSRSCAKALLDSGLFEGPRYRELESWCPLKAEDFYKESGRVSEDFIVRDALLEVDIEIQDHPEIFSAGHVKRWRAMDPKTLRRVINTTGRYSVTHPWKLVDLKWAAQFAPLLTAAVDNLPPDVLSINSSASVTDSSLAPV